MRGFTNSDNGFVAKQIGEILQQDRSQDDTFLLCDGSMYDCASYRKLSSYFPFSDANKQYEELTLDLDADSTNFSVFYNKSNETYYIFYRKNNSGSTVSKTKNFVDYENAYSSYIPNYYVNGVFLYVGGNTIYSSIDGEIWTLRLNTSTEKISTYMAYNMNQCYITAVTQWQSLIAYTSIDAISWTRTDTGQDYNVVYGSWYCNNKYYFSDRSGNLYESSNGLQYEQYSNYGKNGYISGMDYGNNIYMIQVQVGNYDSYILTSTNLEVWTQRRSNDNNISAPYIYPSGLVFYNGIWFIQDDASTQIVKYSLNDGINWNNLTTNYKNKIIDFWITEYYTFYSDSNYPTPGTPHIYKSGSFQFRVPNYNNIAYIKSIISE